MYLLLSFIASKDYQEQLRWIPLYFIKDDSGDRLLCSSIVLHIDDLL